MTPHLSPAGLNRLIYYPDRLVRLPSPQPSLSLRENIWNLFQTLREPLFKGFLSGILFEHTKPARMPHEWAEDESVASFMSRRFNSQIADNLVSAMIHGIYAGDIDKLSAQALFGSLRDVEDGGVVYNLLMRAMSRKELLLVDDHLHMRYYISPKGPDGLFNDHSFANLFDNIKLASTFTFRKGNQQLIDGLAHALMKADKVDVKTHTEIQSLNRLRGSDSLEVCAAT